MKKTYITHVTRDYLPLLVYCINLQEEDKQRFNEYENIQLRNME